MFEPLKETIELLHFYEQELQEESHKQLEELPEKWEAVKKQVGCNKFSLSIQSSRDSTINRAAAKHYLLCFAIKS